MVALKTNRTEVTAPAFDRGQLESQSHAPSTTQPRLTLVSAKVLMAITGAGLLLFVVVHMAGNLQIYLGQATLNAYAAKLKGMPILLWSARAGLLTIFTIHVGLAFYLQRANRRARPQRYVIDVPVETTLASRTMLTSGLVVFAFVIYHLLHFTLGSTDPHSHRLLDSEGRHDVYSMVVLGFRNVYVSAAYIVAMLFLGLHLSHATSSIFQTLGLAPSNSRKLVHRAGVIFAAIIMLGNISIPLAVLLGFVGLPSDGGSL
jgi:succinate dehydrogenase / fumarate reductase cytochrome b subunit